MFWADQPGPGNYRLVGARTLRAPEVLVALYAHANSHRVSFVVPIPGWRMWPGYDMGGRPTGACPATSCAAIRMAERLCADGPDLFRGLQLVWRWELLEDRGRAPDEWVFAGPVQATSVRAGSSNTGPGHALQPGVELSPRQDDGPHDGSTTAPTTGRRRVDDGPHDGSTTAPTTGRRRVDDGPHDGPHDGSAQETRA